MHVMAMKGTGGPEILALEERPDPVPGPDELCVRVVASALNRADLLQLRGGYPAPPDAPQDVPGLEYAGEVEAVGARVRGWAVGDRVMGLVGGGAWSERLCVSAREALRVPESLELVHAAAVPEAFLTALDALVLQGGLRAGETVLVHAVASGVGSAAAQLARAAGARVVGTARSLPKLARAAEWGVDHALHVPGRPPGFADAVRQVTGGRGADLALELVGGDYLPETLRALAPRGRVLLVGLVAGREATLDLSHVLSRRLSVTGTVLRSRAPEEKALLARAAERHLLPLLERGRVSPVIDAVVPMRDVARALGRLAANETTGKLVVRWDA